MALVPSEAAQSIAIVLGAVAAFIIGVGGFIMQVMTFMASRARDRKLELVHSLVNSQTDALKVAIGEAAFADGHAAGVIAERIDPHLNPEKKPPAGES